MEYKFLFPCFGKLDVYDSRHYCLFHANVVPGVMISFKAYEVKEIIFDSCPNPEFD